MKEHYFNSNSGVEMIARERARQIEQEGWSPQHDDKHTNYQLSSAACCYAQMGNGGPYSHVVTVPPGWPFHRKWWKPELDPIDNLAKAGALIAAEIDRVVRARQEMIDRVRAEKGARP